MASQRPVPSSSGRSALPLPLKGWLVWLQETGQAPSNLMVLPKTTLQFCTGAKSVPVTDFHFLLCETESSQSQLPRH